MPPDVGMPSRREPSALYPTHRGMKQIANAIALVAFLCLGEMMPDDLSVKFLARIIEVLLRAAAWIWKRMPKRRRRAPRHRADGEGGGGTSGATACTGRS